MGTSSSRVEPAEADLKRLLGDRFTTSVGVRDEHGQDESPLSPAPPDAVAFPSSNEDVVEIMKICWRHLVPVIPFGAGSSLEGHVLATQGGLSVDMKNMDQILAVRVEDLDATVQAGVRRKTLNDSLRRDGLFFPVDPGADATLGGMVATGASGTTTVRYGAMRENVLSMKVVLADGSILDTAHRARKSSAGYDLTGLFLGSEGTLGVITEVTVRLRGIPEVIGGAVCHFADVEAAVDTVIATMQMGVPVARIEFLDESAISAINKHSGTDYPEAPLLLLEFHGSPREVEEQTEILQAVTKEFGALGYTSAIDSTERAKLWSARHDSYYASRALRPGSRAITTDVCVPISQLARCITETRADISSLGLITTIVGHVGDGNFHVMILVDPEDPAEMKAAEEMSHKLIDRALAMDGTCTGEHGIGLRKIDALVQESPGGVNVMRSIKNALDPNNLMNPGKVLRI
jgi:D-lactate dehydrogenase (cytochrome)